MLEISSNMLGAVLYLYRSAGDAEAGLRPVGSGFAFHAQGRVFAVTNWHVAVEAGASVVRHTRDSARQFTVLPYDPADWFFNVAASDLAVVEMPDGGPTSPGWHVLSSGDMVTKQWAPEVKIGDGAFMLGLFVDQQGHELTAPIARFGRISMLASPANKVRHRGQMYECFLVDMQSKGGFSGAPVFRYREFTTHLSRERGSVLVPYPRTPELLGVQFAQFNEEVTLTGLESTEPQADYAVVSTTRVRGVSGMSCVAPAWQVTELIEKCVAARRSLS